MGILGDFPVSSQKQRNMVFRERTTPLLKIEIRKLTILWKFCWISLKFKMNKERIPMYFALKRFLIFCSSKAFYAIIFLNS